MNFVKFEEIELMKPIGLRFERYIITTQLDGRGKYDWYIGDENNIYVNGHTLSTNCIVGCLHDAIFFKTYEEAKEYKKSRKLKGARIKKIYW